MIESNALIRYQQSGSNWETIRRGPPPLSMRIEATKRYWGPPPPRCVGGGRLALTIHYVDKLDIHYFHPWFTASCIEVQERMKEIATPLKALDAEVARLLDKPAPRRGNSTKIAHWLDQYKSYSADQLCGIFGWKTFPEVLFK